MFGAVALLPRGWSTLAWGACAIGVGLLVALLPLVAAAGLLAAVALLVLVLVEPLVGLLLMLSIAPLKTLIATETPVYAAFDPGLGGLALTVFGWFAWRMSTRQDEPLPYSRVLLPVLAISAAFSLSLVNASLLDAWLVELLKWAAIALLVLLVVDLGCGGRWHWIAFGVVLAGMLQALIGVYEFTGGSGAPHLWLPGFQNFRAFGTFGQPNPYSAFMGLTLPLSLGLAWGYARHAFARWRGGECGIGWRTSSLVALFYSAACMLLLAGLIVSWGRGAWLGFGAAAGVMVFFAPPRRSQAVVLVASGAVLVLALWVGGLIPASIQARITSSVTEFSGFRDVRGADVTGANYAIIERMAHWQAALNMARAHPFFGVGAGHYEVTYSAYGVPSWPRALGHAHNDYLNMLAETGIIGLTVYLVGWAVLFVWTVRARRQPNLVLHGLVLGLVGTWTHLAVHSVFDKLYVNNLFLHIGVMLGLLAIAERHHQTLDERWEQ